MKKYAEQHMALLCYGVSQIQYDFSEAIETFYFHFARCMFSYLLKGSRVGLVSVKPKFNVIPGKGNQNHGHNTYRFLFLSIGIRDFDK